MGFKLVETREGTAVVDMTPTEEMADSPANSRTSPPREPGQRAVIAGELAAV